MRAFILRRVELVTAGVGDVVLIGSTHSAGTHRIKEFLMRNGHPYTFIDLELDPDVQNLLDSFHITASEIPVSASTKLLTKPRREISSSSAPVPLGWLRQCMALQKDLMF
jgi:hypothetical protein